MNIRQRAVPLVHYTRRELLTDAGILVAAALFDIGVASNTGGKDLDPLGMVVWAMSLGALLWRRRHPLPVLSITAAAAILFTVADYRAVNIFPFIVAVFGAVVYAGDRRVGRWAAVGAGAAVMSAFTLEQAFGAGIEFGEVIRNTLLLAAAIVLGDTIRTRNSLAAAEVERARQEIDLERQRTREAVSAERLQIARELHDIVAHSVTVMNVQLGGARLNMADDPQRAGEALADAEAAGRRAMRELRRMLTVLRGDGSPTEDPPLPGLDGLKPLIEDMNRAGLAVSFAEMGDPVDVSEAHEASIYRIVQEALTNVVKHAGGDAGAHVELMWRTDVDSGGEVVAVKIADTGLGGSATGEGFGLIGMRERVELFGGQLTFGPIASGGFGVAATLPLDTGKAEA